MNINGRSAATLPAILSSLSLDPRGEGARFSARMGELDSDLRAKTMAEVYHSLERRNLRVRPEALQ